MREARHETVVVPFPKALRSDAKRRKAAAAIAAGLETVHHEALKSGMKLTAALIGAALLALGDEGDDG